MKTLIYFVAGLMLVSANSILAETEVKISGEGRVRWEQTDNADFNESADDATGKTVSRFRLNFDAKVNDEVSVFIQPQFVKEWGARDGVLQTSGDLRDTNQTVHQAYLNYKLTDIVSMKIGRQELAYGDHLVIGTVGWSNVGRVFDAVKMRNTYEFGWVDLFYSDLVNDSGTTASDHSFSGLYTHFNELVNYLNELEVYMLYDDDAASTATVDGEIVTTFSTYGVRTKSIVDDIDVVFEYTGQTEFSSNNINLEAGFEHDNHRVFLGYSQAHKDYRQLYPTGHKWLGVADLFSRRNITDIRLGVGGSFMEDFKFTLAYHMFSRTDGDSPVYKFSGKTAYGNGTQDGTDVGSEIDFSLRWAFNEAAYFQFGGGSFTPGDYLKNVAGTSDATLFTYLQTGVKF